MNIANIELGDKMGIKFYVSEDEELEIQDVFWHGNSATFNEIFKRIASHFRYYEIKEKKLCFIYRTPYEFDLTPVDKKTFNIFYLRCEEAFYIYHDKVIKQSINDSIISHWEFIIKLLKKDKRYDHQWIEDYQTMTLTQECMDWLD